MALIDTLVPLFAIIALGFGATRLRYLDPKAVPFLGAVVIRVALPALIFLTLANTPPDQALDAGVLAAYAAGSLATMGLCMAVARWVLGLEWTVVAVVGLGVSMANSGFMGFPISQGLMGAQQASILLAHCMSVENILILPLALVLISAATTKHSRGDRLAVLRGIVTNPLLIALLAGLVVSAIGLGLPSPARATLDLLARLSAPLALLVIGGMLATLPVQGRASTVAVLLVGKLVLHPLTVWAALGVVGPVTPALATGAVLFAAMPMITIFPILSARAGQMQLGAYGLLAATLTSFASLPIVIYLLGLT
jgi:malonate transporter and related proteins